jgi:uncharacterized membrane protein YdbT with pleckstrin-like domain
VVNVQVGTPAPRSARRRSRLSRAAAKQERAQKRAARKGATLKSVAETTAAPVAEEADPSDAFKLSAELEQD